MKVYILLDCPIVTIPHAQSYGSIGDWPNRPLPFAFSGATVCLCIWESENPNLKLWSHLEL